MDKWPTPLNKKWTLWMVVDIGEYALSGIATCAKNAGGSPASSRACSTSSGSTSSSWSTSRFWRVDGIAGFTPVEHDGFVEGYECVCAGFTLAGAVGLELTCHSQFAGVDERNFLLRPVVLSLQSNWPCATVRLDRLAVLKLSNG